MPSIIRLIIHITLKRSVSRKATSYGVTSAAYTRHNSTSMSSFWMAQWSGRNTGMIRLLAFFWPVAERMRESSTSVRLRLRRFFADFLAFDFRKLPLQLGVRLAPAPSPPSSSPSKPNTSEVVTGPASWAPWRLPSNSTSSIPPS